VAEVLHPSRGTSEGPEVRRTADALAKVLEGEVLVEPTDERVAGARVTAIRTHGKHIVLAFDSGLYLHNHLMMWGKWRTYARRAWDEGRARPPKRYRPGPVVKDVRKDRRVRLVLATATHVAVEFNGPLLRFTDVDPSRDPGSSIARLGPDALAKRFSLREALARWEEREAMKLADLLLDQTFVAGVGNKYKSDVLFLEKLDPFARAGDLSLARRKRLIAAVRRILAFGYENGGRSRPLGPGEKKTDWLARHWVFRRGGKPCYVCGTRIVTDRKSSARVTYHCPACQPVRQTRKAARQLYTRRK
jgi:endonuclease-8